MIIIHLCLALWTGKQQLNGNKLWMLIVIVESVGFRFEMFIISPNGWADWALVWLLKIRYNITGRTTAMLFKE